MAEDLQLELKRQAGVRVDRPRPSHGSVVIRCSHPGAGALELELPVRVAERLDALLLAVVALPQITLANPLCHLASVNQHSDRSVVQIGRRCFTSDSRREPILGEHPRAAALQVARSLVALGGSVHLHRVPLGQVNRAVVRYGDRPLLVVAQYPANRHKPLGLVKRQIRLHSDAQFHGSWVP